MGAERRVVKVAGRELRVRTTASDQDLREAVDLLEQTLLEVGGESWKERRDSLLLAALALAGKLVDERRRVEEASRRVEELGSRVEEALQRVERAERHNE